MENIHIRCIETRKTKKEIVQNILDNFGINMTYFANNHSGWSYYVQGINETFKKFIHNDPKVAQFVFDNFETIHKPYGTYWAIRYQKADLLTTQQRDEVSKNVVNLVNLICDRIRTKVEELSWYVDEYTTLHNLMEGYDSDYPDGLSYEEAFDIMMKGIYTGDLYINVYKKQFKPESGKNVKFVRKDMVLGDNYSDYSKPLTSTDLSYTLDSLMDYEDYFINDYNNIIAIWNDSFQEFLETIQSNVDEEGSYQIQTGIGMFDNYNSIFNASGYKMELDESREWAFKHRMEVPYIVTEL